MKLGNSLSAIHPQPPSTGKYLLTAWLSLHVASTLFAADPIQLNEIQASNVTTDPDNADFDDYSDWIELHNSTNQTQSLAGYFLTDNLGEPLKWQFPRGAEIPAQGYLVVRADGFDAGPEENFKRAFSPWSTFTTIRYHTNFNLSALGEEVGLYRASSGFEDIILVPLGATWRYQDTGTNPGNVWMEPAYNDALWKSGKAQLGYGDDDETTLIEFGPDENNKYVTDYFRTKFNLTDTSSLTTLQLRLLVDDGALVYLNGTEVARVRMPSGNVDYQTLASANASENKYDTLTLPLSSVRPGENVLAVEVHQVNGNSSDVSFDLELIARQMPSTAELVDSMSYGQQRPDLSLGRDPANPDTWALFGEPTPGAANITQVAASVQPAAKVDFALNGGFFPTAQAVALSTAEAGGVIHYTLDGSLPTSASPVYQRPLPIIKTTVLRARVFVSGKVPGPLATQTYFINEPDRPLPVVSFVVEPRTFFDNTLGIYKNIYKGREAPVNIAYYDLNKALAFQVNAGAKIGGENIWRFAQKPLNVALSSKYGNDLISYKIFPSEDTGTFDEVGFRNGGDNWPTDMLRDPMAPSIVQGQMDNDYAAYRPCVLYMNGQYWGIHNVRGRLSDSYFFNKYAIASGNYDLLVVEHTINGTELVVNAGTADAFVAFENFATSNDLTQAANYNALTEQMDVDSLIDYASLTDYVYESSWHHNQEFWRERRDGAKWRWNINDIDRGFNGNNVRSTLIDDLKNSHPLFGAIIKNTQFRDRFVQRYAAHLSSTFQAKRIADILDTLSQEVDPEIQRHIDRWKDDGGIQSIADRQAEFDEIKQFAVDRPDNVYADMANELNISGSTSNLTVNVTPSVGGRVLINGVPMLPEYSKTARLYRSIAFDVTAEAAPGYTFAGWSNGEQTTTISQVLSTDTTLTATFVLSGESLLPAIIESDTILTSANGPYTAAGDITIMPNATLTFESGVHLQMPRGASIYVEGSLNVNGTDASPVHIESLQEGQLWGAIGFTNPATTSTLTFLTIRGATHTAKDPVNLKSAVSNYRSTIVLDHVDIDAPLPVFARGGSTTLRFCHIHPQITGDGINIKGGQGLVEDSIFLGNESPDTDAIDFDSVVNGVIRRNRIYVFRGSNSDAIDIGEGCVNLLISENKIFHSSDKGISVGQGSVVHIEKNLIVACVLGIGIKDTGSLAYVDQNTFVGNDIGVAVYEKNLDAGGGGAVITNTIFSRCKTAPATVDSLSQLAVAYSLSDTIPIIGQGNLVAEPQFVDPGAYDFALMPTSPAINAGDPAHALDSDGTQADIGAEYTFHPDDYPFRVPNSIVINEVLSHSHDDAPDWIELHNTSEGPIDISGWYLSDSKTDLEKYRIQSGTVIPPSGYVVFYEDTTFGETSKDSGRLVPFALSENGETLTLYAPGDDTNLPYLEEETFGPSATGVSKGRYRKSTGTYNFVAMTTPTPGAANSAPLVGPIVISEIMYHPQFNGNAEYLELANISTEPVTLFGELAQLPWRFTSGIVFDFPSDPPLTMAPGERLLLVRDEIAFRAAYNVPENVRVFQWMDSALNNGGENVELSMPGDVDLDGVRQWIRVDRVNYGDNTDGYWPTSADGDGQALTRIDDSAYGNDVINWTAAEPTPGAGANSGTSTFDQWALSLGLPVGAAGFGDDADHDGLANGLEYAIGSEALYPSATPSPILSLNAGTSTLSYGPFEMRQDVRYTIQTSNDLTQDSWTDVVTNRNDAIGTLSAQWDNARFARLRVQLAVPAN